MITGVGIIINYEVKYACIKLRVELVSSETSSTQYIHYNTILHVNYKGSGASLQ